MRLRASCVAVLLCLAPLVPAEAAPRPARDLATLAATQPVAYAAYRHRSHHRVRRGHRRYAAHVPYGWITHPRWPGCYDRYPFYCVTPEHRGYAMRHRAVLRVRG